MTRLAFVLVSLAGLLLVAEGRLNRQDAEHSASLVEMEGTSTPKSFFEAVGRRPAFFNGRLTANEWRSDVVRVGGFSFVKRGVQGQASTTAKIITAPRVEFEDLLVKNLYPKGNDPIRIYGKLQVDGELIFKNLNLNDTLEEIAKDAYAPIANTAFIETLSVPTGHDGAAATMPQWRVVAHDTFDSDGDHGWTANDDEAAHLSAHRCGSEKDRFLVGSGCQHLEKHFEGLPAHQQVEVTARVHFLRGSGAGYLSLDGHVVWVEAAEVADADECGRVGVPVKVIVPHSTGRLVVRFGMGGSSTECDANTQFGLDDVSIAVHNNRT